MAETSMRLTTKDEMLDAITRQRLRLADTLASCTDAQWDAMSLCQGWKVRDVVGHLLTILEIPVGRFLTNVVKARSFDTYADTSARSFGAASPSELLPRFRAQAPKRFAPPFVGPIAPLADVVIHTRDIEVPLGIASTLEPTVLVTVLDYVCGGKARGFVPPKRTNGLRFEATDLNFAIGFGETVRGPGAAILLAVTGRSAGLTDLEGPGVSILRDRQV